MNEKRGRICLAIPCYGDVPPEVLEDYMRLAYYLGRRYQEWDFILGIKSKTEQFRARITLGMAAIQAGCEFIFWLDDDQILDWKGEIGPSQAYEILHRLIEHMDANPRAGIIGGLYYQREGACFPVLMHGPKHEGGPCTFLMEEEIERKLQKVDVQGGGVMLMRCEALAQIPQPWWEPEHQFGTDIQICRKMAELEWEVWSDTSLEVGHIQKQRTIVTSENRDGFITDFASKVLEKRPETLQICIAGWYFDAKWLEQLKHFNSSMVCNRAPEMGTGIPFVLRENTGLEFGAYSHFLREHWDGKSSVLFCHDDVSYEGNVQTLLDAVRFKLGTNDQFYVFSSTEEVAINAAKHGRMFAISAQLLTWMKQNGGIWYDANNKGEVMGGPINLGVINFDYLMALASTHEFRTRGLICDPSLKLKRRGGE